MGSGSHRCVHFDYCQYLFDGKRFFEPAGIDRPLQYFVTESYVDPVSSFENLHDATQGLGTEHQFLLFPYGIYVRVGFRNGD